MLGLRLHRPRLCIRSSQQQLVPVISSLKCGRHLDLLPKCKAACSTAPGSCWVAQQYSAVGGQATLANLLQA